MTSIDQIQIDELLKQHKSNRIQAFLSPKFEEFKSVYNYFIPRDLHNLYLLTTKLVDAKKQFESIWIESFLPLSSDTINESARRYSKKYYQFASGGEGQGILVCLSHPETVWIDYHTVENSLEEFTFNVESIVSELYEHSKDPI